ncbi:PP2C family protein-serine/threonine phosphatase [Methanobrevibacter sp.]|uniref:PP2C family protein-serine/threonine phosphatase n=1 Tax=Methanobrevibacter sp. TaxID=66852 RepID=UPI0025F4D004|nr:PP2C family protein-serine/threonine phosphatase [Methanobrevibacter sp.]MBQ6512472.1 serine/threonine-protein phosphatase [Methanobrevibacter sp.]
MKSKIKIIAISFTLMILIDVLLSENLFWNLGIENPHVGLLFVLGLLLGPYGSFGAVLGNIVLDLVYGYHPIDIIPSAILSFGVSYLAYKLWYSGFKTDRVTKPRLDNIYHLNLFLAIILICGMVYSTIHGNLMGIMVSPEVNEIHFMIYFLNFINISFIFGILGIWLSKKIDFIVTPKMSKRPVNKKLYRILFYSLLIVVILTSISIFLEQNTQIMMGELILIGIPLFAYLTKPFEYKIQPNYENTITENIIKNFLIITLSIAIIGVLISILSYNFVTNIDNLNMFIFLMPSLIITDVIIILFLVPGIIILRFIENKVVKPISSFSEIEEFINENEKIESEGLLEIYSEYIDEKNEIGTLACSYTELINHNNSYIENIHEIEGEKERIEAELNVATRIQAANLPTKEIENEDFIVDGYSKPAKEVGGDFFDYYMLDDDNLAMVIGDASGKGVPAALVSMITQVNIKEMLKHTKKPETVLYLLNNQLCENNTESMFLTLWLGIYNKTTKKLTFSNAGHNPPLIKENDEFKYMDIESGLVLGIMEDFKYVQEETNLTNELLLYTDGITDANNKDNDMYGEDRLLNFLNEFESDDEPISPLLNDIHNFTKDAEQYDDMTLLCLKIKND